MTKQHMYVTVAHTNPTRLQQSARIAMKSYVEIIKKTSSAFPKKNVVVDTVLDMTKKK